MKYPSYASFAKDALGKHIKEFDIKLNEYFDTRYGHGAKEYYRLAESMVDVFREYTLRPAKRLRGSFVLRGYEMITGRIDEWVWDAAVALEVLHAFLLVIDDFQDLSMLRRMSPTVHEIYRKYHEENYVGDAKHYGISIAALVGILSQHHAANLLLELDTTDEIRNRAARTINETVIQTAYGQSYDIDNQNKENVTEHDVMEVHRLKTAYYTYFNPLQLGFILAGASQEEIDKLLVYTEPAGIAFQIQDDILGVFGEPEKTGKSNMDDIMEGKSTLLTVKALEKANSMEKDVLRSALGDRKLEGRPRIFKRAQEIIEETGSLDYSKTVAKQLVKKAKDGLYQNFGDEKYNNAGRDFIAGIADYMIERDL